MIQTVRGAIAPEALGATLMHEHIIERNPELEENYPHPEWNEEAQVAEAVRRLGALKLAGIDSLVDLTVLGLGRSIPRIQRIGAQTDVNIVVATGYYLRGELPMFFQRNGPGLRIDRRDPLEEFFLADIQTGIADTGVRAAIIKIVSEEGELSHDEARVMRAAAVAQLETGVPISTHSKPSVRNGLAQQKFFTDLGVLPERLVIGHSGDSTDVDYLRELLDNGSTLGLDRFGTTHLPPPEEQRIDMTVRLIELGYEKQLVLSHDAGVYSVNTPPSWRKANTPYWNYLHIPQDIVPKLIERGVAQSSIDQMLTGNPRRILTPA